jgi:predicted ATP-dependent serine protease
MAGLHYELNQLPANEGDSVPSSLPTSISDRNSTLATDFADRTYTGEVSMPTLPDPKLNECGVKSWSQVLATEEPAVSHLVDGLLLAGGSSLWVAKPKVGKSTALQNLASCVATAQPFLDRVTTSGAVLYLALEELESEVRKHFLAMELPANAPLHFSFERSPEAAVTWLSSVVDRLKPVLIIIDTFQKFTRVHDISAYAAVTNAMEPITSLARRTHAHVAFSHHGTKAHHVDGGDSTLGSTALFGGVDTLIHLTKTEHHRSMSSIQRYGENLPETIVTLDKKTYRVSIAGTKADVEVAEMIDKIIEFLKTSDAPVDDAAISEAVEGRKTVRLAALRKAVDENRIMRLGSGLRGDPYMYYLPQQPTPQFSSAVPANREETGNRISDVGTEIDNVLLSELLGPGDRAASIQQRPPERTPIVGT